jgi:hypothetical protein
MKPNRTAVNLIGGIKPALARRVNAPTPKGGRKNENWRQIALSSERALVALCIRFWQRGNAGQLI